MIVERMYPQAVGELRALVEAATAGAQCVVIQAGHFLLYHDDTDGRALPCIASELIAPRHEGLRREVGMFPLLTWRLGVELLGALDVPRKYVVIVVNDWQYVPRKFDRSSFYDAHDEIPAAYAAILAEAGKSIALLRPPARTGTGPFFGEKTLRNQYQRNMQRMLRTQSFPLGLRIVETADELTCSLPTESGRYHEVYCSNKTSDCAAEIAQLIHEVDDQVDCDCFINLFPAVCRSFVEAGTEFGNRLFSSRVGTVLNVGLPTSGVATVEELLTFCEATLHRFAPRPSAADAAHSSDHK